MKVISAPFFACSFFGIAFATSLRLEISPTGTIGEPQGDSAPMALAGMTAPLPQVDGWSDSSGLPITALQLDFSSMSDPLGPARSWSESLQVIAAGRSSPLLALLTLPDGCRVGATEISQQGMSLATGGKKYRNGDFLSFESGALRWISLDLGPSSFGLFGDVSCLQDGDLTFTATDGDSKRLRLSVAGSVYASPRFTDPKGAEVKGVSTAFSGPADASGRIQSQQHEVSLRNAVTYPATLSVTSPSGCSAGSTPIVDEYVEIIWNDRVVSRNINVSSNRLQSISVGFRLPPGATGAILCARSGQISYEY